MGDPRAGGVGVGCRRPLRRRDCRGIGRAQRMRHLQPAVSLFLPQPIRFPSENPRINNQGQNRFPKTPNRKKGKEKKQTPTKRKSGSAWPVLAADWAACFFIDEPCSFHFHHHCSAGGSSERMHGGMGMGCTSPLSCCAGGFGISTRRDAMRCDAMVPVTECWPTERDDACWPFGGNHRWL